MLDLKQLTATLEGGEIPPSFDAKTIGKISKRFLQWKVARVVNLYPIRGVSHEDSRYCLYACPLNGTTIDEETLRAIHAEIDSLEIGHIRYDSVQSEGADYYILDEHGNHCGMDADDDIVAMISDRFDGLVLFTKTVFSPKKQHNSTATMRPSESQRSLMVTRSSPCLTRRSDWPPAASGSADRRWRFPMLGRSRPPWRNTARR